MILLSRNAQNIYWVGRYLNRIQYLCNEFPFQNDQTAIEYAHAFCLPAFDACSLNELVLNQDQAISFRQQFQCIKNNIQDLRGVLSIKAYTDIKTMIQTADQNAGYICTVVDECSDVLETENEEIFLFYSLGHLFENIDRQIRLSQDITESVKALGGVINLLKNKGCHRLDEAWQQLQQHPNSKSFYQLNDQVQYLFEVNA